MTRKLAPFVLMMAVLVLLLAGCRNETQNRIRRSIQDFTNIRMYITVMTPYGDVVFEGIVDGKVTRATAEGASGTAASGTYIYWYDEDGRYHQTDLPYFATTYDRSTTASQEPAD